MIPKTTTVDIKLLYVKRAFRKEGILRDLNQGSDHDQSPDSRICAQEHELFVWQPSYRGL